MRPRKFFNGSQDLIKELNDLNDDIGVLEQKVEEISAGSSYQPPEFNFKEDGDKELVITLTNEQYSQIISAINNKEEIIAYANCTSGEQTIKLPLIHPIKIGDTGTVAIYSGVCGYVSYILSATIVNWVLFYNVAGDGSYKLALSPSNEFTSKFGLYINSGTPNEMTFADAATYYDWATRQGDIIHFDSINGNPVLHTTADINSYYAPTTINETATPKILQSINSKMSWVDIPKSADATSLTLNLMTRFDANDPEYRTTLTKEEKEKWEAGYYSNVQYIDKNDEYSIFIGTYLPQVVKNVKSEFEGEITQTSLFVLYGGKADPSSPIEVAISKYALYGIKFAETANSDGTYNFTVEKAMELPFASGGSSIPTLATTFNASDYANITLTDEDIATIQKQENILLGVNVEYAGLPTGTNLFGVSLLQENTYLLTYISGKLATLLAFEGGAPVSVNFVIDVSTKHITQFAKTSALTNASSLIITKSNKIYLSSGVQEEGLDPDPLNKQYYIDTINGQSIFHENQSEAKDHVIPTIDDAISETSTNPVQNKVIKAYVDSLILTTINGSY